jgi:hypothetical protein
MVANILANINNVDMAKVYSASPTKMYIWGFGKRINSMEKEYIYIQMEKDIKVNSYKVKNQVVAPIIIKVEQNIKENGKKIKKMGLAFSFTQIIRNTKEIG